ncbi:MULTISPECIES: NUDIX domain-containing protein [Streptomyces]|uniref:NUDIX domain-containing protein n=1 Tax=Streptomyces TaxID=1883 RepID=UPI001559711D|nr:NUDIX domain-containing protein [Streptomyces kasugaensis]
MASFRASTVNSCSSSARSGKGSPPSKTPSAAGFCTALPQGLKEAVLREVAEETGLLTATVVRKVAVEDKPHPDTGQPRRTSFFFLQASADTSDAWDHQVSCDGDDAGLTFACRFLPLPLEQPLADDQDAWLGHIDPRWTTVTVCSQ